jgi:CAAX prenyl protease-like protein
LTLPPASADLNNTAAGTAPTNHRLLFLYAAPYFGYVAMGSLDGLLPVSWIYILRLLIVPGFMLWAWRWYRPLRGEGNPVVSIAAGILAGLAGTVIWIILITPFVKGDPVAWENPAFFFRLAASSLVVPVFEELLMRGYVFYFVLQWDQARKKGTPAAFDVTLHEASIDDIRTVSWNMPAILISTIIFALGHQVVEWPAAVAYGLLMACLLISRKDLLSAVVAHGITNLCLGMYVFYSGNWQYW